MQALDLEQPGRGLSVIACLRALLLIAADAERAVAGAGQAHDADGGVGPGRLQAVDQLVHGAGPEGVQPLLPVDLDPGQAVVDLVPHIGQVLHFQSSSLALAGVRYAPCPGVSHW